MDINIKELESKYKHILSKWVQKIDRYSHDKYSPIFIKEYCIHSFMNLYKIIQSYSKEKTYYVLRYDLDPTRKDNLDAIWDIISKYESIGFIVSACNIDKENLDLVLSIPNNDINLFKEKLLDLNYKELSNLNTNMTIEKIETLYLYKILEQDELDWNKWKSIRLKNKSFKSLWVDADTLTMKIDDIETRDRYYNKYEQPNLLELILLRLYLKNTFSYISGKADIERMPWVKADYILSVSDSFKRSQIIHNVNINKEVFNFTNTTRSIKIIKKSEWFILHKEHEFFWSEHKYVELQNKYPHADIIGKAYFGKTHKYIVIEKIKLTSIDI